MITDNAYLGWLALWLACGGLVLWSQRRDGAGSGLTISYVLQLFTLHWLGASIYALPWYGPANVDTQLGLIQSAYGIGGFAVGSAIVLPVLLRRRFTPGASSATGRIAVDPRVVRSWLAVGVITYFGLEPILHDVPTLGAIASAAANLLIVALAIECWNGLQGRASEHRSFWRWVLLSGTLPIMTIVTKGFLGYGFASMLTVFAFVASFYRPRWKIVAWSLAIGYLALSLYVTYMRDRRDIREVVWSGQAYASRFSAISRTLTQFEFMDIQNVDHLSRIDERLNQNFLLGRSVEYLQTHPDGFANGRTLWEAVLSPIPRLLWPGKPGGAGSGTLVTEFTGIRFTGNTSVGIGHILEWYVNFGALGVFFGMLGLGLVVSWIDNNAAARLREGDPSRFIAWWLPGLSLLQVGGSLVEAVSSAAAGMVIAWTVHRVQGAAIRKEIHDRPRPRGARRSPMPAPAKPAP